MPDPIGREIHSCRDAWGTIRVFDDGRCRHMRFGRHDEQSCVDLKEPQALVYEYTQAMVLGALFTAESKRVLVLGLGGGALVHALRFMLPEAQITVVERRQKVVDTARHFFGLRDLEGVDYQVEDAELFMQQGFEPWDLIFTDLYDEEGVSPEQSRDSFLEPCMDRLSEEGVLVLNLWSAATDENSRCLRRLREGLGGELLVCEVSEGNRIVYGRKGAAPWSPGHFVPVARRLGRQLGCPLHRRAAAIRRLD